MVSECLSIAADRGAGRASVVIPIVRISALRREATALERLLRRSVHSRGFGGAKAPAIFRRLRLGRGAGFRLAGAAQIDERHGFFRKVSMEMTLA